MKIWMYWQQMYIIGTLAKACQTNGDTAVISTGDRDSLQLTDQNITVHLVKTKDNIDYTPEKIKEEYDYIIIDCPPSLNALTINAMTTADSVLVPIQCEYYALEGLSQLIHTINLIQDRLNKNLEIDGIVFTMYDSRTNLSTEVVENVKENIHLHIYKTLIPRNVRLAEAPSYGIPIHMYDGKSAGAIAYKNLAQEVIEKNN